jgi:hypothetical protein
VGFFSWKGSHFLGLYVFAFVLYAFLCGLWAFVVMLGLMVFVQRIVLLRVCRCCWKTSIENRHTLCDAERARKLEVAGKNDRLFFPTEYEPIGICNLEILEYEKQMLIIVFVFHC